VVIDGAGVREASDPVEVEGVRRSRAAAQSAHIIVSMREPDGQFILENEDNKNNQIDWLADNKKAPYPQVLHVLNKIDLENTNTSTMVTNGSVLGISCRTGHGLNALTAQLSEKVKEVLKSTSTLSTALDDDGLKSNKNPAVVPLLNRARHRHHVSQCVAALQRYQEAPLQLEVAAEELRSAATALGRVVGAMDTEAVLDNIFSEFCIGK